jgi:hypothetical protein
MHLQLPGTTLIPRIETGNPGQPAKMPEGPGVPGIALDRVALDRRARKVKFYFRRNHCKRCYHDLSPEQVKALISAIREVGRKKEESFVFDDDVYLVTPQTKRLVK